MADCDIEGFIFTYKSKRPWRRLPKFPAVFSFTSEPTKFVRPDDYVGKAPQYIADGLVGGEPVVFAVPGALAGLLIDKGEDALGKNMVYKDGSLYLVKAS